MICRLRGIVREQTEASLVMEVQGVCYQVFLPPSIMRVLAEKLAQQDHREVELVTFHYQQLEVGRGVPVLIGFLNEIEREFFERFITVSGIGPKAALRALTKPIPTIAKAIDEGQMSVLRSLPGIGEQRAKEIIAKLQGKVGKYALIQAKAQREPLPDEAQPSVEEEAVAILLQLEYKKPEAKAMVKAALARNPNVKTAEDVLNEVYRQRQFGEPLPAHERSGDAALPVG